MGSGQPLATIPPDVIAQVQQPAEEDRHKGRRNQLYFEAMKRVLDKQMPGFDA